MTKVTPQPLYKKEYRDLGKEEEHPKNISRID